MGSRDFWCNLHLGILGFGIVFSLGFIIAPYPTISGFNWLFFGQAEFPKLFSDLAARFSTFNLGVMGSVMIGWMGCLAWMVHGPIRAGNRNAWRAALGAIIAWMVLDCTVSIVQGFSLNALTNIPFFIGFAGPLWMARPGA